MTEEAKLAADTLRKMANFKQFLAFPQDTGRIINACADMIESLSETSERASAKAALCDSVMEDYDNLKKQLGQVTRERDALLDELKGECDVCGNKKDCTAPKCRRSPHKECEECPCRTCIIDTNWKWEGVEATDDAQKGSDAKS